MEIRRSYDRLISTMVFPILIRQHLYIESGPRCLFHTFTGSLASIHWTHGCLTARSREVSKPRDNFRYYYFILKMCSLKKNGKFRWNWQSQNLKRTGISSRNILEEVSCDDREFYVEFRNAKTGKQLLAPWSEADVFRQIIPQNNS